MGFMTMQTLDNHIKTAHIVEKTPEAPMSAEVMLVVEKASEPVNL
jgi:hypothetical protein